ncbi:MAG: cytochrome c3 family protein [Chloroflexi bacterium]|nr:cytochrome c3 family protein [Chloroflexota bacterium]
MTQSQQIRRRWLYRLCALAVLMVLSVVLVFVLQDRATATSTDNEMLKFNHQKHVAAGTECVFCHPGTINGPVATLPSLAKCMGCHQNVQVTNKEGQANVDILMRHWEENIPLRWEKTHDQPDFVYFTHQPHIAAEVNCENCHGDVSQKTVAYPAYRINMGFCLNCHRQQSPEKVTRLESCSTCHQ